MSNEQLQSSVADELRWDPKLDSSAIAVAAENGIVTLGSTVGSFRPKHAAKEHAERVRGVTKVDAELEVRLMGDDVGADADIRGAVLQAFVLNDVIPPKIDAKVFGGVVTLTGTAHWQYQLDEGETRRDATSLARARRRALLPRVRAGPLPLPRLREGRHRGRPLGAAVGPLQPRLRGRRPLARAAGRSRRSRST